MKPSMSGIIQIAFMEWGILSLLLIYPDIQPSLLVSFSFVVLHLNTLPLFIRGSSLTCHYLVTDIAEMNQSCGSVVEISQISLHDAHRTYCVIVLLKVFHDQSSLCDAHRTYCVTEAVASGRQQYRTWDCCSSPGVLTRTPGQPSSQRWRTVCDCVAEGVSWPIISVWCS